MRVMVMVFLFVECASALNAQTDRLYALTYKFKKNESYRVSVSTYFNMNIDGRSPGTSGEASFDLIQAVDDVDGEFADLQIRASLSRCVHNGKNLTYQLARAFEGQVFYLSVDRFGKLYGDSVFAESGQTSSYMAIRSDITQAMPPLPSYPVRIGDTWNLQEYAGAEQVEALLGSTELSISESKAVGKFALLQVQDGVAKVRLDAEISGAASIDSLPSVDFLMKVQAEYFLDIGAGMLTSGQVNLDLAAATTLKKKEVVFRGSRSVNFLTEKIK